MTEKTPKTHAPLPHLVKTTRNSREEYKNQYKRSIEDRAEFWAEKAERLHWSKKWDHVFETSFDLGSVSIEWFKGASLNACYNCVDRHLEKNAQSTALIWEADDPEELPRKFTFQELHEEVVAFANVLKGQGVQKGDRVTLYMPMIPEAVFAMLACARLGAVHSVVFGGFSAEALAGRINDCESRFVVTADWAYRSGKSIALKKNVDQALESCSQVSSVVMIKRSEESIQLKEGRDFIYEDLKNEVKGQECPCEEMSSEDPLFILYTSGSTGKPKGLVHTTGGYLLYASFTHENVFDYKTGAVYWCTADVGWITGHSYVVYGPLANAATTLISEGVPNYPTPARHWELIDKHNVEIYYTAPTALRALMKEGNEYLASTSRKSLKILGTVGEPINPEAWNWYYEKVGKENCAVVDTWWQTETGGVMIAPLPGATALKAGSATNPQYGIEAVLLDAQGKEVEGAGDGCLCIRNSWPGQARTIYGDHERFEQTYFSSFPGYYFSGDECHRDEDGYYWIRGRADDVINVSGHRLGTAEIESALVAHEHVAEAAVVGKSHEIKGQSIFAYVTLNSSVEEYEGLEKELIDWVSQKIGAIAKPEAVLLTPLLPKTRSGKIMRRLLRKIAEKDFANYGDVSTLANPDCVEDLKEKRTKMLVG